MIRDFKRIQTLLAEQQQVIDKAARAVGRMVVEIQRIRSEIAALQPKGVNNDLS